jgi:hypothetical protein
MKIRQITAMAIALFGAALSQAQMKTMAVSDVKASPGLVKSSDASGTSVQLERVVEAFDSQLIDRMHSTRKFEIVARNDLKELLKDSDVSGGGFKVPGADYVLVTSLDDFQDYSETMVLPTTGEKLSKRVIRVTAVAKIYDGKSGRLIESANVTKSIPLAQAEFNSQRNGELSDALLTQIVTDIADAAANRVVDVIYPAKVVSKMDSQVTINRGDGTAIAVGQLWDIYALGNEIKDPDTGEIIDRERMLVGKIRIIRVNPKTSMAEIVDDHGIDLGAIAQPTTQVK